MEMKPMHQKPKIETKKTLFKSAIVTLNRVKPDDIPIGNTESVSKLFGEDNSPIEFVNEVLLGEDHPATEWGGEIILTEDWAASYAEAVNRTPGVLYARGHEDVSPYLRAVPSGYIVGAKVEKGSLLLRNRLINKKNEAEKEFVEQTMREISAGLISTSTGDLQKRRIEFTDQGDFKQYAIESVKNQTNALVEHDMPASSASIVGANFKSTVCYYDEKGEVVKTEEFNPDKEQGKNKSQGDVIMNLAEHLSVLKSAMKDGTLDVSKLSSELEVEVLTQDHKTALKRLEDAETKVGNVSEYLETIETQAKANFVAIRDKSLENTFKEEETLELAKTLFSLNAGGAEEIEAEITRLKDIPVIKKVQSLLASSVNHTINGDDDSSTPTKGGDLEA